jgi:hypothetical protein
VACPVFARLPCGLSTIPQPTTRNKQGFSKGKDTIQLCILLAFSERGIQGLETDHKIVD